MSNHQPGERKAGKPPLTAKQRIRRARIAAHVSWANTADRVARTAPATSAFLARFERQVDPDGLLPPDERAARAMHARTAYMLQLAERSARARRRKAQSDDTRATTNARSWRTDGGAESYTPNIHDRSAPGSTRPRPIDLSSMNVDGDPRRPDECATPGVWEPPADEDQDQSTG